MFISRRIHGDFPRDHVRREPLTSEIVSNSVAAASKCWGNACCANYETRKWYLTRLRFARGTRETGDRTVAEECLVTLSFATSFTHSLHHNCCTIPLNPLLFLFTICPPCRAVRQPQHISLTRPLMVVVDSAVSFFVDFFAAFLFSPDDVRTSGVSRPDCGELELIVSSFLSPRTDAHWLWLNTTAVSSMVCVRRSQKLSEGWAFCLISVIEEARPGPQSVVCAVAHKFRGTTGTIVELESECCSRSNNKKSINTKVHDLI